MAAYRCGLLLGWALFAIFLTGTLAVFDKEIDGWMRPEVQRYMGTQEDALQRAVAYLQARHADSPSWNINLPTERSSNLSVSTGEQRRGGGQLLDPVTGEPISARETAGGGFFFRFHFTLNMPRNIGIWVVGLAAMAMLVALISGIVIHKKIFRISSPSAPARAAFWLDAHNASGVLLLPFHLMITYTGLVIFYLLYMPAAVDALYEGDRQAASRDLRGGAVEQQSERAPLGGRGQRPDAGMGQIRAGHSDVPAHSMAAVPLAPLRPIGTGRSRDGPGRRVVHSESGAARCAHRRAPRAR